MKRVVLTHQAHDEALAYELAEALHSRLEIFMNQSVAAGDDIEKSLLEQLAGVDALIVILSTFSGGSSWLAPEVTQLLRSSSLRVLPVLSKGYRDNPLFSVLSNVMSLSVEDLGVPIVAEKILQTLGVDTKSDRDDDKDELSLLIEQPDGSRWALDHVSKGITVRDLAKSAGSFYDDAWGGRTESRVRGSIVDLLKSDGAVRLDPNLSLSDLQVRDGDTLRVSPEATAGCFAGEVCILMADHSERPISQVGVGDEVVVTSRFGDRQTTAVVKEVIKIHAKRGVVINDRLLMTPSHPLLVNREWLRAGELRLDDYLFDAKGMDPSVTRLRVEEGDREVYNLILDPPGGGFFAEGYLVRSVADPEILAEFDAASRGDHARLSESERQRTEERLLAAAKSRSLRHEPSAG